MRHCQLPQTALGRALIYYLSNKELRKRDPGARFNLYFHIDVIDRTWS